jgi:antitoxin component of MazEF toxin-antitoxin module
MIKKIKTWGNSAVIVLTKEDLELYQLNEDDIVDLTIIKIREVKNGKIK